LTPVDGTLPTFTTAPLVAVLNSDGTRPLDIDTITTTSFRVKGVGAGVNPTTISLEIISLEGVGAAAPSTAAARDFLYYCSVGDVQDDILNLKQSFASGKNLEFTLRRRLISRAYSKINSALKKGGYSVPVTNSVKQVISESLTASDNVVSFTVTDGTKFSIGDTVRIHGQSGSSYNDEFTGIVQINGNVLTVEFLENSYNSDQTCELCSDGYLYLRDCNAIGASAAGLNAVAVGQGRSRNEKIDIQFDLFQKCLDDLASGNVVLDGLTRSDSTIETYQSKNPDNADVSPVFTVDMKF